jgi:predicted nucleic acid-binding protein
MMKPRVYVETSVVSYLTARPSRDLVTAAHQQITHDWWQQRSRFDLFVSQAVLTEAGRGDATAAALRLQVLADVSALPVTAEAEQLAGQLIQDQAMAAEAAIDALHVAVAVVNGMDYLVTWNCAHIANAELRVKIEGTCRQARLQAPIICTPEELLPE